MKKNYGILQLLVFTFYFPLTNKFIEQCDLVSLTSIKNFY